MVLPPLPLVKIESQRLTTTRWFYGLRWAFPYAGGAVAGFYGLTETSFSFFPPIEGLPLVAQISRSTFCAFVAVVFGVLVIGGPLLGVAQVHREIQSKRMELLRCTPVRPLWIVLQWNLVITLVPVIVGLACLPGLAVTGALGGLDLETMLWLFLLILVGLGFSSAVSVLCALHVRSMVGAMVLTSAILFLVGIGIPIVWVGLGNSLLDLADVHPFIAMIAAYRYPDLLAGPNGPWPPILITLAATGLAIFGAAIPGLPSTDSGGSRRGLFAQANPFDPRAWGGATLYGETLEPWARTLRAAVRGILPRSMPGGIGVVILLGMPFLFPSHLWMDLLSALLAVEMGLIIAIALSAGATALAREYTRPTLPLILTAPLESREILDGCFRGLLLAILPFVYLPVAHVSVFVLVGRVSTWAPIAVLGIGLSTAWLFVMIGLLSSAWTGSRQGGMALGILLGLIALGILPFLSPLVAGLTVVVLFVRSVNKINQRYFTEEGGLPANSVTFSLGCGCMLLTFAATLCGLWYATGMFLLDDYGLFEDIWYANPVALALELPHMFRRHGFPRAGVVRVFLLCCCGSIGAAWGLGIILRENFDRWTDRIP